MATGLVADQFLAGLWVRFRKDLTPPITLDNPATAPGEVNVMLWDTTVRPTAVVVLGSDGAERR